MSNWRVVVRTPDELFWPQQLSNHQPPCHRCSASGWSHSYAVYPQPCYMHDEALVRELLTACEHAYPMPLMKAGALFVLPHEFLDHNNGYTVMDEQYWREDGTKWEEDFVDYQGKAGKRGGFAQTIVLCGKRIPIMPSMTRYLVAHEYGHAVFNYKAWVLGYDRRDEEKLEALYMKARTDSETIYCEPGNARWHQKVCEIIANDFRTVVMGLECEFWPHEVPIIKHAAANAVTRWWYAQTREEMEAAFK